MGAFIVEPVSLVAVLLAGAVIGIMAGRWMPNDRRQAAQQRHRWNHESGAHHQNAAAAGDAIKGEALRRAGKGNEGK
jgi:hypothetical protein